MLQCDLVGGIWIHSVSLRWFLTALISIPRIPSYFCNLHCIDPSAGSNFVVIRFGVRSGVADVVGERLY